MPYERGTNNTLLFSHTEGVVTLNICLQLPFMEVLFDMQHWSEGSVQWP